MMGKITNALITGTTALVLLSFTDLYSDLYTFNNKIHAVYEAKKQRINSVEQSLAPACGDGWISYPCSETTAPTDASTPAQKVYNPTQETTPAQEAHDQAYENIASVIASALEEHSTMRKEMIGAIYGGLSPGTRQDVFVEEFNYFSPDEKSMVMDTLLNSAGSPYLLTNTISFTRLDSIWGDVRELEDEELFKKYVELLNTACPALGESSSTYILHATCMNRLQLDLHLTSEECGRQETIVNHLSEYLETCTEERNALEERVMGMKRE